MQVVRPDTSKIRRIWHHTTLRKIFLDIITNTQLHKCKQVKNLIIRELNSGLADKTLTDEQIYAKMFHFVHFKLNPGLRARIQHKETYRALNRANKLMSFIKTYGNGIAPTSVLDIGCDDGSITVAVGTLLNLPCHAIHGSDIISLSTPLQFTYHCANASVPTLPFTDATLDVVYAFMSLHHIENAAGTITEVQRVLRPGGLFIIREHDFAEALDGYDDILDVVHGFYDMVWANPPAKHSFKDEFWAHYWTASELEAVICNANFEVLLNTSSKERFPLFVNGKVINPLKYYYAVYRKKNICAVCPEHE